MISSLAPWLAWSQGTSTLSRVHVGGGRRTLWRATVFRGRRTGGGAVLMQDGRAPRHWGASNFFLYRGLTTTSRDTRIDNPSRTTNLPPPARLGRVNTVMTTTARHGSTRQDTHTHKTLISQIAHVTHRTAEASKVPFLTLSQSGLDDWHFVPRSLLRA